jgi:hypothetical protein
MDEKIDKAIETVLLQVRSNLKPDEALKATQAVLNMMHAKTQWEVANQQAAAGKRPNKTN